MKSEVTREVRELTEYLKDKWSEMHWIDFATNLGEFQKTSNLSERKLAFCFSLSKSEVHRMLSVSKLSLQLRHVCKEFKTDYHVLCLFAEAPSSEIKEKLREQILNGSIKKHKAAKEFLGDFLRRNKKPLKKCKECKRKIA